MASSPHFSIERIKRTEPFSMAFDHMHDAYEIYYLLSGERYYYIDNRLYALQAGDLIFIHKHGLHRTTNKGDASHERILINFDEAFITPSLDMQETWELLAQQHFLLRPGERERAAILSMLEALLGENDRNEPFRNIYRRSLLVQLLVYIRRLHNVRYVPIVPEGSEKQQRVYAIIEHIEAHFAEKLTLDQLSSAFFISSTYLCKIFRQTTGFTVVEYIRYVRIRQAQQYLKETRWPVTRIAEQAGFDSIAHFGRVFRQMTGRSPLQYRKQFLRENDADEAAT
ncbi:AraC family transcriptional regulator [Paenibacillus sp. P96]|uniref:AraC family transcriptional regulator n=1 Tax=Paenibacillus zeirhizosphaerae TaxID=2987519 RepID=A0ABT9FX54_9BACL|nr:AraC family transcriptional regulator [Paenibacillus sp. P96]MDP4099314.1 AraC family transcriptional regulator [Paenibacillus sp. P96]